MRVVDVTRTGVVVAAALTCATCAAVRTDPDCGCAESPGSDDLIWVAYSWTDLRRLADSVPASSYQSEDPFDR